MRWARVPIWWLRALRGRMLVTAIALAAHADREGSDARPAVSTLAAMTGVAEREVRRALGALRDRGIIRAIDTAPGRATTYSLVLDPGVGDPGVYHPSPGCSVPGHIAPPGSAAPRGVSPLQSDDDDLSLLGSSGEVQEGDQADAVAAIVAAGIYTRTARAVVAQCGPHEARRLVRVMLARDDVRARDAWLRAAARAPERYPSSPSAAPAAVTPRHGPRLVYSAPGGDAMSPDEYHARVRLLLRGRDTAEEAAR